MRLDAIGALFANSWKRFQERFVVAIGIFFPALILILISEFLLARNTPVDMVIGGCVEFLSIIVSILASLALISLFDKNTDFAESYRVSFKLFWPAIWIGIIVWLAVMGAFIMIIIPGIILGIQLSFANYVLVLENRRGMSVLAQSREYVKGYWWAVVGRILLLILCFLIADIILAIPVSLISPSSAALAQIVYGILLLVFTPFSGALSYEIFTNLQRLKPDVMNAPVAAKTDSGFLTASIVVGAVAAIVGFVSIVAVLIFFPSDLAKWNAEYPNSLYQSAASNTLSGDMQIEILPTNGPIGTLVTISGMNFDATNTITMNGLIAARDVSSSVGNALTFVVPASLAPDCNPNEACPQFLLHVMPNNYEVAVINSRGTIAAGTFLVTSSTLEAPGFGCPCWNSTQNICLSESACEDALPQ